MTLDDTHSVVLNDAGPVYKVSARAALQMGPAVLGGQFDIALDQQANGARTWQLGVTDGYASVEANGAKVALTRGTGTLILGANGSRSGSVTRTSTQSAGAIQPCASMSRQGAS